MFLRDTTMEAKKRVERGGNDPLLLSVPEAARLLGIGTTLCWEMIHSGQLASVRLGRRVLIPRGVVERLAEVNGGNAWRPDTDAS